MATRLSNQPDTPVVHSTVGDDVGECDGPVGGFMRELAHELGNIAFPLRMVSELQNRSGDLSSEELREVLENQVDALQAIVGRLRTIGRGLSSDVEPHLTDVRALDIVNDAVACRRSEAESRNQVLQVESTVGDAEVICGDRELLVQALTELIDNSVCFAPPGSTIRTALESRGAGIEFVVADNGPGVSPELTENIFEPFVSSQERMEFGAGHIGCGLAFVRRVAAIHNGTVELRRSPAPGATFAISIPRRRPAGA